MLHHIFGTELGTDRKTQNENEVNYYHKNLIFLKKTYSNKDTGSLLKGKQFNCTFIFKSKEAVMYHFFEPTEARKTPPICLEGDQSLVSSLMAA